MIEKKYQCLKCNSYFGEWGRRVGKYGGFLACCPKCGNDDMKSIQKNTHFHWTKLRISLVGIGVAVIGIVLYVFIAFIGIALVLTGLIISGFPILIRSE